MNDEYGWLGLDEDDFLVDEPTVEVKCECGSKYTTHKNIHSDWCPLYVPPMGEQ